MSASLNISSPRGSNPRVWVRVYLDPKVPFESSMLRGAGPIVQIELWETDGTILCPCGPRPTGVHEAVRAWHSELIRGMVERSASETPQIKQRWAAFLNMQTSAASRAPQASR